MAKRSWQEGGNARHFCTFCRIYIYNNRISIDKHNSSPAHLSFVRKHVLKIKRDEKVKEGLLKEFQKRSGISVVSSSERNGKEGASFYDGSAIGDDGSGARKIVPKTVKVKKNTLLGARNDVCSDSDDVCSNTDDVADILEDDLIAGGDLLADSVGVGGDVSNNFTSTTETNRNNNNNKNDNDNDNSTEEEIEIPKLRKFKKPQ